VRLILKYIAFYPFQIPPIWLDINLPKEIDITKPDGWNTHLITRWEPHVVNNMRCGNVRMVRFFAVWILVNEQILTVKQKIFNKIE
jgi:hypothetical protein